MTATECTDCGEAWAYDRVRCPNCGGDSLCPGSNRSLSMESNKAALTRTVDK